MNASIEEFKIQLLNSFDAVNMYSIHRVGESNSEFNNFLINHKNRPEIKSDFFRIIKWIKKIGEQGAFERYFRRESKFADNVCALPVESGRLRLYVSRLSDQILILGNGGIKTTRTYNEDPILNGYVTTLASIDRQLRNYLRTGQLRIEGKELIGIENAVFPIKL